MLFGDRTNGIKSSRLIDSGVQCNIWSDAANAIATACVGMI